MAYLPLANILHYRLRSTLSALGIGIGICMLITLSGLARGTLEEVGDRWEVIDADLIVYPAQWEEKLVTMSGPGVGDRFVATLQEKAPDLIERIVPIFTMPVKFGGQDQVIVGVDSGQWSTLTGGRELVAGELFDRDGKFTQWMEGRVAPGSSTQPVDLRQGLAEHGGLEIVIDTRLAQQGSFHVGDVLPAAGQDWKIVGIVKAGAMARVFMPRRTAQAVFGLGGLDKSTVLLVKAKPGADHTILANRIRQLSLRTLDAVPVKQYRVMLEHQFGRMFTYINAVNTIAMIIAFLFIMVTLYMMVLQRTREIAILKSFGASRGLILRQVLAEGLILTFAGTAFGIGLSFLGGWLIEKLLPLNTVTITWHWIAIAGITALAGAIVSALYPAWRAMRVDMVETLTLE